jgi:hypothetical protein
MNKNDLFSPKHEINSRCIFCHIKQDKGGYFIESGNVAEKEIDSSKHPIKINWALWMLILLLELVKLYKMILDTVVDSTPL